MRSVSGPSGQLHNDELTLEPADETNVGTLLTWTLDPVAQGHYKRVPTLPYDELRRLILHAPDRRYFLIRRTRDNKPLGRLYYRAWCFRHGSGKVDWELNLLIADPDERGKGYGTSAQALVAELLLSWPETNTVFAYTLLDNWAERHALLKAGFAEAGLMPSDYYQVELPPEKCVLYVRRKDAP